MATDQQIFDQLTRLGCGHKLQRNDAAVFITFHANPVAFGRVEGRNAQGISRQRTIPSEDLLRSVDPGLWVEMCKTVCTRYEAEIRTLMRGPLRTLVETLQKKAPLWVPVALFMTLCVPADANGLRKVVRQRLLAAIKEKTVEDGIPFLRDSVRRVVDQVSTAAAPIEAITAYVVLLAALHKGPAVLAE